VHVNVEAVGPLPVFDRGMRVKLKCTVAYPELVEEIGDAL